VREMAGSLVNEEPEDEDRGAGETISSESGDSDSNGDAEGADASDGDPCMNVNALETKVLSCLAPPRQIKLTTCTHSAK
jgi:hypothetical protein